MRYLSVFCLTVATLGDVSPHGNSLYAQQSSPPAAADAVESRQPETKEAAEERWYKSVGAWTLIPIALFALFLVWFVPLSTSPEADPDKRPKE